MCTGNDLERKEKEPLPRPLTNQIRVTWALARKFIWVNVLSLIIYIIGFLAWLPCWVDINLESQEDWWHWRLLKGCWKIKVRKVVTSLSQLCQSLSTEVIDSISVLCPSLKPNENVQKICFPLKLQCGHLLKSFPHKEDIGDRMKDVQNCWVHGRSAPTLIDQKMLSSQILHQPGGPVINKHMAASWGPYPKPSSQVRKQI